MKSPLIPVSGLLLALTLTLAGCLLDATDEEPQDQAVGTAEEAVTARSTEPAEVARHRTSYLPEPVWEVYVGDGALFAHRESVLVAVPKDGRGKLVRLWMQYFHVYGGRYFESLAKSGYLSLLDLKVIAEQMKHPLGHVRHVHLEDALYQEAVDPFYEEARAHERRPRRERFRALAEEHESEPGNPWSGGMCDYQSSPFCGDGPWVPPPPPPGGGASPATPGHGGAGGAPGGGPPRPMALYCGGAGGAPVRSPAECPDGELDYGRPTVTRMSASIGTWLEATLRKTFGDELTCIEACNAPAVVVLVTGEACEVPAVRAVGYGIPCLALGTGISDRAVGAMTGVCTIECTRLFKEEKK